VCVETFQDSPDGSGIAFSALAWVVVLAKAIRTDSGTFQDNEATDHSLLKILTYNGFGGRTITLFIQL